MCGLLLALRLDAPGEFYVDGSVLYVIPPAGVTLDSSAVVEAAVERRVIQLRGASSTSFAHDIVIKGLTVEHSAPTYVRAARLSAARCVI